VSDVNPRVDILMISHERPEYYMRSLTTLLDQASRVNGVRVWLWMNGDQLETKRVFDQYRDHPVVARAHHSSKNAGLRTPTNWLWLESDATFVSKVDDDCVIDDGWIERLMVSHAVIPNSGVLGSWRFYEEDSQLDLIVDKIQRFDVNRVFRNNWVQGSGYLARRSLVAEIGALRDGESFPDWCLRVAKAGYVNGWPYPFLHEEHFDDPRSAETMFTTDEIFMANRPLHAKMNNVKTLADWANEQQLSALGVQRSELSWMHYFSFRERVSRRVKRAVDTVLRQAE
jgi:GT2 family glycosyltransferase